MLIHITIIMRVAFPSSISGMIGPLSFHFGHATTFTIVDYDPNEKRIEQVEIVRNVAHQQGECLRPIRLLMNSNVDAVVIGGIGKRPLAGFRQFGFTVYQGKRGSVKENFKLLLENLLPLFTDEGGCKEEEDFSI